MQTWCARPAAPFLGSYLLSPLTLPHPFQVAASE